MNDGFKQLLGDGKDETTDPSPYTFCDRLPHTVRGFRFLMKIAIRVDSAEMISLARPTDCSLDL